MTAPPDLRYNHPLGPIDAWFSDRGLCAVRLGVGRDVARMQRPGSVDPRARALRAALDRYFAGFDEHFDDVSLDLDAATPFRRAVWEAARETRWGALSSYGALSRRLGRGVRAARAVGQALGANPVPLVVPCHRFLAANGALGGFSAGLAWKRALLGIEGHAF